MVDDVVGIDDIQLMVEERETFLKFPSDLLKIFGRQIPEGLFKIAECSLAVPINKLRFVLFKPTIG